jgi:transferase CAF17, mitochondrial
MFTSFLSPQVTIPTANEQRLIRIQGRVLFDVFIYSTDPSFVGVEPLHPSPMYLIEVDRSRIFSLKWHFDRYQLRNKFRTYEIPASQVQIFSVWPALPAHAPNAESVEIVDPRSPHLGTRMLTKKPPSIEPFPMEVYDIRRTLHGVPEGAEEIIPESALPAESNLDVMSGIDFTKGCYIGQELTSRTYHTGIIRKRLLPLSLFPANGEVAEPMTLAYDSALSLDLPPSGTSFKAEGERRSPGKFLRGWGNIGWGLVRLDNVGKVLKCDWEGGSILAKPFLPEWVETEKDTGTVEPLSQETVKDAVKYGHPDEI